MFYILKKNKQPFVGSLISMYMIIPLNYPLGWNQSMSISTTSASVHTGSPGSALEEGSQ